MNEMIERAAKAIYDSYAERLTIASPSYEEFKILHPVNFYKDLAKAAIQAMREPTNAMKSCSDEIHWGYSCHVCGGLTEGWYAMIDKALADV